MSDDTKETEVEETEADETENDVVETEETDAWTPPSKEDWEKLTASAKTARQEAASRRKWLKEHGIDPHSGKKLTSDKDDEAKDEVAAKLAAADAKARKALTSAVRASILAAGADKEVADLLIGKIKFDELDVDDDGSVEGLDDQLDDLKEKYARLFEREEPAPKRTKAVGGTVRKENAKTEKTYTQLLKEAAGM